MQGNVIGFMKVNYTSKTSGRPVRGYNLFVATDIQSDYGKGKKVDKLYLSDPDFNRFPEVLGMYEIYFNQYGNIDMIQPLK